ncbi:MAG: bifunctional 5,10-methylene-tetrahydrofolate dehydrogenase/5,10-methylene-tetrahydrofolate cyclohydrolase [Flavobacteriales bacterium]|nr:bifunctional 5,10-methylene-tetrahydrofolate dehydrogenase/5,10-methylene-tetrahydrofolate cyclohydrolase [Flavobacteriales bacterium]
METSILDGKGLSQQIKEEIAVEVADWVAKGNRRPHLAAVLVGQDGASRTYVDHKVKSCAQVGFESTLIERPADIGQEELLAIVAQLNEDPAIDGFIVQLPLPSHIDDQAVIEAVSPLKDVDGFHPSNMGNLALGLPGFVPATPAGIMTMLDRSGVETEGKHAVVIGRSSIVGTPMSLLLSRSGQPGNCTVTLCHSRTQDLQAHCLRADILVAAVGRPGMVTADMVKEGAVVIDVGITRVEDSTAKRGFRLKGDVDYASVAPKCSWITPVPGGVGPMTIVSLLKNTLLAARRSAGQA